MPNPSDKDWNKEFQELLELPDTEEKFARIRHLAQDFISIGKYNRDSYYFNFSDIVCIKLLIALRLLYRNYICKRKLLSL